MKNIIIISLLLGLMSCMTAEKHLQKFYNKGGKLESVERVVTITDTVKGMDGKDSIVEKLVEVDCPEPVAPKTKWEVRFDNRRFNDSLKHMRRFFNDSVSYELKVLKSNNALLSDSLTEARKIKNYKEKKESNKSWLFWLGVITATLVLLAIQYLYRRFKKILFIEN